MSQSWRLNTIELDNSTSVQPDTNNVGATVIESSKGSEVPLKISKGDTNRILNIFGVPTSSTNRQVFDVIKYNEVAPVWVSAPSKNGKYGGVYVTKTGTQPFSSGFSSKENVDFEEIDVVETIGTGDASTTSFTLTLDDYEHYNNTSAVVKIDGTELASYAITDAATEVITATELSSGTYVRATGVLSLNFNSAPASGSIITVEYTVDRSDDVYFILFNTNPQTDDLGIIVEFDTTEDFFSINAYIQDESTYLEVTDSPYIVSLTEGTKDGFGQLVYIGNILEDDDYLDFAVNTSLTVSTFQVTTSNSELAGIGDGSTKSFSYTLENITNYVNQSIDITVDGTTINVSASDANPEVLTTTPSVGTGTLNRTTGALSFTFSSAPASNAIIRATYNTLENIDSDQVDMAGGDRGDTIGGADLVRGWNQFQSVNTYPADIFFDITANPSIPTTFDTLRSNYQKYSAYILPLPNASATSVKTSKTSYGVTNRGVYYYWNWLKVRNVYNDDSIWTPCIGPIAVKHAQMVDVYNGLAPAWIDENDHGGQLSVSVLDQAYDPDEATLKDLDKNHINPIHLDLTYGPMIKSQRTSISRESDYAYIAHSRTADYIMSNIINLVLPYQLVKLNDTIHRSQVKANAESIVSPLSGSPYNLLRDYLIVCDSTNNTDVVLSQRKFILNIYVKFTPFSETIDFYFVNTPQGAEVGES